MSLDSDDGSGDVDQREIRRARAQIRDTDSLAELARMLEVDSEHEAYFRAKRIWALLPDPEPGVTDGLPGDHVRIDGRDYFVHGITHANTEPERDVVHTHVTSRLAGGVGVYCEQGIRPMYLADLPEVCEIDDYRWAMRRCATLGLDVHIENFPTSELEGLVEDVSTVTGRLRESTFSLIESGRTLYGEEFTATLGDVASSFLTNHEDLATGEDFEAFAKTRRAAEDPSRLGELQDYYRRSFLPQPLEREWLRRHDRQLEIVTHARNERMADYVVHEADAPTVEVIVGAAHQPGVTYYLEQYRDGHREPGDFEYVE